MSDERDASAEDVAQAAKAAKKHERDRKRVEAALKYRGIGDRAVRAMVGEIMASEHTAEWRSLSGDDPRFDAGLDGWRRREWPSAARELQERPSAEDSSRELAEAFGFGTPEEQRLREARRMEQFLGPRREPPRGEDGRFVAKDVSTAEGFRSAIVGALFGIKPAEESGDTDDK